MTQQIGPYGVFNPNAQSIGGGVQNPSSSTPGSGSVSAWPMNEGSGLTLNDVSGNVNTATISGAGAVTWQANAGLPGTTPLWTATGSALATSATLTNFTGLTPFSVGVWAKPGAVLTQTFIGDIDANNATSRGWEFRMDNVGQPTVYMISDISVNNYLGVAVPLVLSAVLHYFVFTYDGSRTAAGVKIYVDGAVQTTTTLQDTLTGTLASGLPVTIARDINASNFFSGPMAFIQIVNTVWSAGKIAANFALGPAIYTP